MIYRCKMCGGDLDVTEGSTIVRCEYCGNVNTVPKTKDDDTSNLFVRANELRRRCEFDFAEKTYTKIIDSGCDDSEAYWGLVLSRFGIEYVDDPATGKKIPTCHRAQYEAVSADYNYKKAIENADALQRPVYEKEARKIDLIQKEILIISQKEDPFDVFICYKEKDADGRRTQDSVIANDIYYQLTQQGYKVFYAAITLEDKLGQNYEPIIFAALNSAKVMLVIGTRPEYFKAVWVKNEWSRYLKIIQKDRTKRLFPCYRDMDPYDLPEDFAHLQAQDMSKIGFINDIVRGIEKVLSGKEKVSSVHTPAKKEANVDPLLRRAFLFLEDKVFDSADECIEKVLDNEPENALAYLGKLMIDLKVPLRSDLGEVSKPFVDNYNYKKICRFGDESLKAELDGYLKKIEERNLENAYDRACNVLANAKTIDDFEAAKNVFTSLGNWKDSSQKAKQCEEKSQLLKAQAEEKRKEEIYKKALTLLDSREPDEIEKSLPLLESIKDFKDSAELIKSIPNKVNEAKNGKAYIKALTLLKNDDIQSLNRALEIFKSLSSFRNTDEKIRQCLDKIEQIEIKAQREKEERERKERKEREERERKEREEREARQRKEREEREARQRKEREEREERERLEREKAEKRKKKKLVIISSIVTIIVVASIIVTVVLVLYNKKWSAYNKQGKYVYFGTYPQTEVTDDTTKSALSALAGTLPDSSNTRNWNSYGYYLNGSVSDYMWYIDLEYSGEKYRGVYFTSYRPDLTTSSSSTSNSYQDDNGYNTSIIYWFKYEPIKWRILKETNNEALILCEMIIDSQNYYITSNGGTRTIDGKTVYENNYEHSTIRAWLNDTFYNTAFTSLEKELILKTTVDNSARSTNPANNATAFNSGNNSNACANTEDYIFLLSEQEVTTSAYGFNADYSNYDTVRRKQNTDYAKSQGCYTETGSYAGNGWWWLRSPCYGSSNFASYVYYYGSTRSIYYVLRTDHGVVPALKISLS